MDFFFSSFVRRCHDIIAASLLLCLWSLICLHGILESPLGPASLQKNVRKMSEMSNYEHTFWSLMEMTSVDQQRSVWLKWSRSIPRESFNLSVISGMGGGGGIFRVWLINKVHFPHDNLRPRKRCIAKRRSKAFFLIYFFKGTTFYR